jgi:hypothetical protein
MAFKKAPPPADVAASPDKLFLALPRRKIPDVLPHQREVLRQYSSDALNLSDVALQLPTGSGKTLVGLLIAEWRRRKNSERIVYLCPTRQLVNQVVEQASEKYGLTVLGFSGRVKDYDQSAKAKYQSCEHVAVTTYSSLFNTNPYFKDPDIILLDDAHAAEQYVASLWSLRLDRRNSEHATAHAAVASILKPILTAANFSRLTGAVETLSDAGWVDKIPSSELNKVKDQLIAALDINVEDLADLQNPWKMIRDHVEACHLYVSPTEMYLRPLIPPTWTHEPFENAKQRIYMSATLGAGGDLERLMGRPNISRLPVPEGWDKQGVGRRFFIFPRMSLDEKGAGKLRIDLMKRTERSLILVPSDRIKDEIAKDLSANSAIKIFSANDLESSKKAFVNTKNAAAVVANRYDGIDFPGDECRLLFVEGLPTTTNIQERFLMSRMGANVLFNERIQVRVLQAIGRCTRSLQDFSAVVASGDDLTGYLADVRRRKYLHPELQAEIAFGVEQSKDVKLKDLVENFEVFLKNDSDWEEVNDQIVAERNKLTQEVFPAINDLSDAVSFEVEYQKRLWQSDFFDAFEAAGKVLAQLDDPKLRGYRALWHYLAGSAAHLGSKLPSDAMSSKARTQFENAKKAAIGIPWLVDLARHDVSGPHAMDEGFDPALYAQIERLELVLEGLGTVHERDFAKREKEILDGIQVADTFEQAQKLLGETLGYEAGKIESEGSPDPWWISGDICIVFEDYVDGKDTTAIDVTKARQAMSHPEWMKANVKSCGGAKILSVIVSHRSRMKQAARPHLEKVAFWSLSDFQKWAHRALEFLRELRKEFSEPGDLSWRAFASKEMIARGFDARSTFKMLEKLIAAKRLQEEK